MCAQFANSLVIRQVFCQTIFLVGRVGRRAAAAERNQAGCLVYLAKMDNLAARPLIKINRAVSAEIRTSLQLLGADPPVPRVARMSRLISRKRPPDGLRHPQDPRI
jgi:hypothetical protein